MKIYFKDSLKLFVKTLPFLFLKAAVYLGIALFFLAIGLFFLWIISKFAGIITLILVIFMLLFLWGLVKVIRKYILYLIKAGHIAVLAELIQKGELPKGKGMIGFGFEKVKATFVTTSIFWVIDELISAIVNGISNFIRRIGRWIPVQAVQTIFNLIANIVAVFLSFIDEAILSYIFIYPEKDPWKGARDGLVLYFKSWKPLLMSSVIIVLLNYVVTIALFFILLGLTTPIAALLPFVIKDAPFIIALIIAGWVKIALLDQFTLVLMVTTYQNSIKGLEADSETMEKLEQLVPKFKEITAKAGKALSAKSSTSSAQLSPEFREKARKLGPYIRDARNKGFNDSQIKETLMKNGWPENVIDEGFKNA